MPSKSQHALRAAAGEMRLLGPNTIGAMDLTQGIVLSASGALEGDNIPKGGISVASQSGGILGALLSRGSARGIGFCKLASTGNEADIDISDLIEAYANDADTRVIAAYVEGIRSVEKFRKAAAAARAAGTARVQDQGALQAGRRDGGLAGAAGVCHVSSRRLSQGLATRGGTHTNTPLPAPCPSPSTA